MFNTLMTLQKTAFKRNEIISFKSYELVQIYDVMLLNCSFQFSCHAVNERRNIFIDLSISLKNLCNILQINSKNRGQSSENQANGHPRSGKLTSKSFNHEQLSFVN